MSSSSVRAQLVKIVSFSTAAIAFSFICGALASGLAGFFGMKVATLANTRTTNAAREGLMPALRVSFSSGVVMGMSVVGLALLGVVVFTFLYSGDGFSETRNGHVGEYVIERAFVET